MKHLTKPNNILNEQYRVHITSAAQLEEIAANDMARQMVVAGMREKNGKTIWEILANRVNIHTRTSKKKKRPAKQQAGQMVVVADDMHSPALMAPDRRLNHAFQLDDNGEIIMPVQQKCQIQLLLLPTARLETPEQIMDAMNNNIVVWSGKAYSTLLRKVTNVDIKKSGRAISIRTDYISEGQPKAHEITVDKVDLRTTNGVIVRAEVPLK